MDLRVARAGLGSASLIVALSVTGCGLSTASPSPNTPAPNAAATALLVSPAPSIANPVSTPASTTVSPPPTSLRVRPEINGKIVFYRTDDARSTNTPFMINPDGSHETEMHDGGLVPGVWSPDGRKLLVQHLVTDPVPTPGAETRWIRPATVNADGSGFRLLDAYPDRKMQLAPIGWSSDGRILLSSGGEDVDPADRGLYSARSSDGGDLTRILALPPGHNDIFVVSPDRTKILVNRSTTDDDRALFVINADGTGQNEVSPPGLIPANLEFYDGTSAAWSPVGPRIAFGAGTDPASPPGLYVMNVDGSGKHRIVSPDIGAVSAQWSPDGSHIAFTSKLRTNGQVWVAWVRRQDAVAVIPLTDGADGSSSIVPVWSPDGKQLLFQRRRANEVTLWTMHADGSGQKQLSATPLAADYVGGYAWWPAIGE